MVIIDTLTNLFTIQDGSNMNIKSLKNILKTIQNSNLSYFVTNQVRTMI